MTASDPASEPIAVGCAELPPGMSRSTYFRRLSDELAGERPGASSLLEMRLLGQRAPGRRVAERWHTEAGGARRLSLVAPRALFGFHRPGGPALSQLQASVEEFGRTASHAQAAAVVFVTPPDLSPSTAHRNRLRHFFSEVATAERFDPEGRVIRVWQPDGLWPPSAAAAFAEETGIVAAVDPLSLDPLAEGVPEAPAAVAYARVSGLGRPNRPLGEHDLARLAEWAAPSRRAFVVFATPTRFVDAIALLRSLR